MAVKIWRFVLHVVIGFIFVTTAKGFDDIKICGYPGKPAHGFINSEEAKSFHAGSTISYSCDNGYVMFDESIRVCEETGIWSGNIPKCSRNLALEQPSLQSETLGNYEAGLAVDGDPASCSFTPSTVAQRWWQVHLGNTTRVQTISVTMSPGSYQHFTIFVIELLDGNKALYKPCSKFQGQYETERAVFLCNNGLGHTGQFVYLRDDREEQEYFGLCEVEVFPNNEWQCGEPEQPFGSLVTIKNRTAKYSCEEGFALSGPSEQTCTETGEWTGETPVCSEVECPDPMSPKNGYIEVTNFKGRYQMGSVATYRCNPGFILWGNASRRCDVDGAWSGETPMCHPITCGQPPEVSNAVYDLISDTTVWKSQAVYNCIPGYSNSFVQQTEGAGVISECSQDGSWSSPSIRCHFDPVAAANNMKKGRSLSKWGTDSGDDSGGQLNLGTIITIGVLSALLVLSLIIVIIILTHKKAISQVSSRKTSHSSNNHLILNPLDTEQRFKDDKGSGVVLYDDLNAPHRLEPDSTPDVVQFPMDENKFKKNSLTTFSSVNHNLPNHEQADSPLSERYSGDGGSQRSGYYELLQGECLDECILEDDQEDESPYSYVRRFNSNGEENPYSSVKLERKLIGGCARREEPLEETYEVVRPGGGQREVDLISAEVPSSPQALYAKVDVRKKMRWRQNVQEQSDLGSNPTLPRPQLAVLSPLPAIMSNGPQINLLGEVNRSHAQGHSTEESNLEKAGPQMVPNWQCPQGEHTNGIIPTAGHQNQYANLPLIEGQDQRIV